MFLARLEEVPLSKAYTPYVVEGGRPITQSKNFIWKTRGDYQCRFMSINATNVIIVLKNWFLRVTMKRLPAPNVALKKPKN